MPDPMFAPLDRRYAYYALGLLVFLFVINYIDRQVLAVLLVPIQQELGASDTAMGFLTGLAFALFYTTAGVPIAVAVRALSARFDLVTSATEAVTLTTDDPATVAPAPLALVQIGRASCRERV